MKKADTARRPGRCHKCVRKAEHKLVDKWYCRKCFCRLVEQKIRHNLRRYRLQRDSRLCVPDKASEYVINKVVNVPVQISRKRQKTGYLVMPWTMDDENEEFLRMFFENRTFLAKENKRIIKLFYPVSKKDMKTYFNINKVRYAPEKTPINSMLDSLEDKYPGTKTGLLKSEERLRTII
jgi:hypothetical protein